LNNNYIKGRPKPMDDVILRIMQLKQKGYCCAQILLILALEAQGEVNAGLVRAVQGLCFGVAMSGEICGALSGGVCLISLYTAKGSDTEEVHERFSLMTCELVEWFRNNMGETYGGIRCDDILTKYPDKSVCGSIVAATYGKAMEILMDNGLDPSIGKND
jgi:C_GCAxxG_C_C family probable redox protein